MESVDNKVVEPKKKRKRRSTSAPGQYYGYSVVQGARLLHRLLEASPGETVSIEGLDDIAVEGDCGLLILEQDKSGLAHNPVTDKSIELWKTLRNWLDAIRSGKIPADTKFILYVAQSHTGSVVERLHKCQTAADGAILARTLRNELWGEAPHHPKKTQNPDALREQLDEVLDASDEVLGEIFQRFELIQGSGSPYEDIKSLLSKAAIGDDAIEPTHKSLIGWCQKQVAKCIETKHPPVITQADFHKQLLACARKFDRADKELVSTYRTVTEQEITNQLQLAVYIKQMRIVGLSSDHQADAVAEYLRAAADRAHWGLNGYVLEDSFLEYQNDLKKHWRRQKEAANINPASDQEEIVGKKLFLNCMEVRLSLQRMPVPDYFTPGTFHTLADTCQVGWHPRFLDLLNNSSEDKK